MEKLFISKTAEYPAVRFDPENGRLRLLGKSFMEDSASFYAPLMEWLQEYKKAPHNKTEFTFSLEYMNTSSSKFVLDIFQVLDEIFKNGNDVKVIYKYYPEDEDMEELGKQYEEIFNLPFEYVHK